MSSVLKDLLRSLARLQLEHTDAVIIACLVFTAVLASGIPKIQIQTDFQEGLPQDLPPIVAEDKVEARFGNIDSLVVLFQTSDEPVQNSTVTDIRDPRMVETLNFLSQELKQEPIIESTNSMSMLFDRDPSSKQQVKQKLSGSDVSFTNRDYTATTMYVKLSEEMTEENVKKATRILRENIRESPLYPGVEAHVTGLPAIRTSLSSIIISSSAKIIGVASILILMLLTGVRGIFYGPATFVPLFMGLVWTLGAMGWLGLPLTIVTVALASMLLGLGVEYGSFIAERIVEEAEESDIENAVMKTMPNTGEAVLGSSTTDLIGFLALLMASISFIQDLGLTLALGEALTLTGAIVLTPALIIKYERWNR
ncbi:MAG: MMPL family transporter [Candidatus Nanohalobium sp.]